MSPCARHTPEGIRALPGPLTVAAIVATFLLAGTLEGVIGLGLTTVSLGVLAARLDLRLRWPC